MKISIEGMHCRACVRRVEKALSAVEAAKVESVEIGTASVSADPSREQAVLDAVRKAGYEARTME
jgi:copper chaperone CopZ